MWPSILTTDANSIQKIEEGDPNLVLEALKFI